MIDEKPKKRVTTEDKLKVILDEHYARVEKMVDEKLDAKLDHTQYRLYKSFAAEMARWYTGHYEKVKSLKR